MKSLSLTGGSGDVNPQWLKLQVVQTGADTFTQTQAALPIQRARTNNAKAQVIELLKVAWNPSNVSEVDSQVAGYLTTRSYSTAAALTDGPLIAYWKREFKLTTSGTTAENYPVYQDLTDSCGHGILIGTDNIYMACASSSTGLTNTLTCWLLYRFKYIGSVELLGILQSQQ